MGDKKEDILSMYVKSLGKVLLMFYPFDNGNQNKMGMIGTIIKIGLIIAAIVLMFKGCSWIVGSGSDTLVNELRNWTLE